MSIVNLAAYRFVTIESPEAWRPLVTERCQSLGLRGTILLAPEGISLFIASPREATDAFIAYLREDALFADKFADLQFKESLSDSQPFRRMLVRIKREIITMKKPAIQPELGRAPSVDARTLKDWLDRGHDDQGRPVVMLDTRKCLRGRRRHLRPGARLPHRQVQRIPGRDRREPGRSRRQDRGVVLHRRDPLRKGRNPHEGHRPRLPARGRHPEVFRGSRRRALSRRLLRVRPPHRAQSAAGADRRRDLLRLPRRGVGRSSAIAALRTGPLLPGLRACPGGRRGPAGCARPAA